ncbi:PaaX family transcriptional regulator [Pseudonocardia spinosispora]|uniref:PaaX family transcriptional regulator n=1 Tax=Pseudonocardia spinosispora TaxID=103441 RepID=UPI00041E232C|nr:PaaX family transcriptional regulator C-terminal domain-containing protein [Pseudonocardia spinosispora]
MSSGSARSLLLTILGELVYPNGQPVWTASLLHVMTGLGVEEQTARQTIARSASAGWLTGEKHGREVRWQLSPSVKRLIEDGMKRVYSLQDRDEPWHGDWLILLVSVPKSQSAVRKKLYSALSWVGFGNPTPGVWLSPHPERIAEAEQVINDLDLTGSTLTFTGQALAVGLKTDDIVARAWALDDVAEVYRELLDRYRDARPGPGDATLFAHVELVSQLQRLPFLDPQLPDELLPGWIGRSAVAMIQRRRAEWYETAQLRWLQVAAATSPT